MSETTGQTAVLSMELDNDDSVRSVLEAVETKARTICQGFTDPIERQQFWGGYIGFSTNNERAIGLPGADTPYVVIAMPFMSNNNARHGLDAIEQEVRTRIGGLNQRQQYERCWRKMVRFGQENGLAFGIDLSAAAAAGTGGSTGTGTGGQKTTGNADRTLGGTAT